MEKRDFKELKKLIDKKLQEGVEKMKKEGKPFHCIILQPYPSSNLNPPTDKKN